MDIKTKFDIGQSIYCWDGDKIVCVCPQWIGVDSDGNILYCEQEWDWVNEYKESDCFATKKEALEYKIEAEVNKK